MFNANVIKRAAGSVRAAFGQARAVKRARAILKGTRGESLMEGLASILVFTVLIASVTMMIMVSLRITHVSTTSAANRQEEANATLAGTSAPASKIVEFIINDDPTDIIEVEVLLYESENFAAFTP